MAAVLGMSTATLANKVLDMNPTERYAKMKKFYLAAYPKTKHFYAQFSGQNKAVSQQQDYYENLNTFEDVLQLIDKEDESMLEENRAKSTTDSTERRSSIDLLFEDFIQAKSSHEDNNKHATDKYVKNLLIFFVIIWLINILFFRQTNMTKF